MKIYLKIAAMLCMASLASCATHHGSISSSTVNSNATYRDIAYGISDAFQVFGMGGTSKDALVLEARKQLILNRPLAANETYANVTVDIKKTRVIIYTQTKVTVSADVVYLHNDSTKAIYSENYLKKINQVNPIDDLFAIGDSVVTKNLDKLVILGFENLEKVRVGFLTTKNKLKTKTMSIYKIYTDKTGHKGKEIGAEVDQTDAKGELVYVGLKNFLYRDRSQQTYKAKY